MPARWKLLTALWTVYLVWGSTYLAIKISVRTLPPLYSSATRFALAGTLLALIIALTGRSLRVTRRELGASALLGLSLLTFGVGMVTVAETRIDSSVAAMIAGSVPLQVILLRTLAGDSVALATRLSVGAGLVGLGLIVLPGASGGATALGLAIMLGATVSWSLGSFFSGRLPLPADPFVATAYEMLAGGVFLFALAGLSREHVGVSAFSFESVAAWAYLVLAGSLIGFTAYAWLLRNAPISKVVTHQYVNPLVAIMLGAALLGEELSLVTAVGAALIVGSVFVAVRQEGAAQRPPEGAEGSAVLADRTV